MWSPCGNRALCHQISVMWWLPAAPVVKWISHRPPEPGVEVRFLSGALRSDPGLPVGAKAKPGLALLGLSSEARAAAGRDSEHWGARFSVVERRLDCPKCFGVMSAPPWDCGGGVVLLDGRRSGCHGPP